MSTANDGGPAFPIATHHVQSIANVEGKTVATVSQELGTYPGMTLRDWFAGMALQGIVHAVSAAALHRSAQTPPDDIMARWSYDYADSMLAARERKEDA